MNSKPIEPLAYFPMLKQGELFPPEQMSDCFGICPNRPTALPIGQQDLFRACQITATVTQIDREVYAFYGLSEKERKLVET